MVVLAAMVVLAVFSSVVIAEEVVAGPTSLEVGQVANYCLVNNNQLVFIPDADCPRGCVVVSGPSLDSFDFLESDGNALSITVRFREKGDYEIFFKRGDALVTTITVK